MPVNFPVLASDTWVIAAGPHRRTFLAAAAFPLVDLLATGSPDRSVFPKHPQTMIGDCIGAVLECSRVF